MSKIFNQDFIDFISALNHYDVEYILVGGYAVILHGYNRTTGDLDIWVKRSPGNYRKILMAFGEFGLSVFDMTEDNFLKSEEIDVFSFGVPPVSIDIMTAVKGLDFKECYSNLKVYHFENLSVRVLHLNDLIKAKVASNRFKDLDDIQHLKNK